MKTEMKKEKQSYVTPEVTVVTFKTEVGSVISQMPGAILPTGDERTFGSNAWYDAGDEARTFGDNAWGD